MPTRASRNTQPSELGFHAVLAEGNVRLFFDRDGYGQPEEVSV